MLRGWKTEDARNKRLRRSCGRCFPDRKDGNLTSPVHSHWGPLGICWQDAGHGEGGVSGHRMEQRPLDRAVGSPVEEERELPGKCLFHRDSCYPRLCTHKPGLLHIEPRVGVKLMIFFSREIFGSRNWLEESHEKATADSTRSFFFSL